MKTRNPTLSILPNSLGQSIPGSIMKQKSESQTNWLHGYQYRSPFRISMLKRLRMPYWINCRFSFPVSRSISSKRSCATVWRSLPVVREQEKRPLFVPLPLFLRCFQNRPVLPHPQEELPDGFQRLPERRPRPFIKFSDTFRLPDDSKSTETTPWTLMWSLLMKHPWWIPF